MDGLVEPSQNLLPAITLDAIRCNDGVHLQFLPGRKGHAGLGRVKFCDFVAEADVHAVLLAVVDKYRVQSTSVAYDSRVAILCLRLSDRVVHAEDIALEVVSDHCGGSGSYCPEVIIHAPSLEQLDHV